MKPLMEPLAIQGRISAVVLGEHVKHSLLADLNEWAEGLNAKYWETLPVDVLLPVNIQPLPLYQAVADVGQVFHYPHINDRQYSSVFPSNAVIQGNMEQGRRDYDRIFENLVTAINGEQDVQYLKYAMPDHKHPTAKPHAWGYKTAALGKPFVPDTNTSPFKLHLVGQVNPNAPLKIPVELEENVISIHQALPYPVYYDFLAHAVRPPHSYMLIRGLTVFRTS